MTATAEQNAKEQMEYQYLEDAQGRLVPLNKVRPQDLVRDLFVKEIVTRMELAAKQMAAIKARLESDMASHLAYVAEHYGVQISGEQGSVALISYDGCLKVERDSQSRIAIGEEIHAAEALIREIIDEIQDDTAVALLNRAFRRNRKTGELTAGRVIDLINVEIDNPRWERAVRAIRDSIKPMESVTYFRAYRRDRPDQRWQQIDMDFSKLHSVPLAQPRPPANAKPSSPANERPQPPQAGTGISHRSNT